MNKTHHFFHKANQIMGIVNVTPDSFSDGGKFETTEKAVQQGLLLVQEGADCLDVGGQSTRPGYKEVSAEEESRRILPVIRQLSLETDVPISVDTYFPSVAKEALLAGATIVNDVNGLDSQGMIEVIRDAQCGAIMMHSRKRKTEFTLVEDLQNFYQEKVEACLNAGIPIENLCVDPGIGFHKTVEENGFILKNPEQFRYNNLPLLIGLSRKRIIGTICGEKEPAKRDIGSTIASLHALQKGAEVVRVHNVKAMRDAVKMAEFLF